MNKNEIEEKIEISKTNLIMFVGAFKSQDTIREDMYNIHFKGVSLREEKIKILESMLEVRKTILQELSFDITKIYSDDEIDWSITDTHTFDFKTIEVNDNGKKSFLSICIVTSAGNVKYATRWTGCNSYNSRDIKPMYYDKALEQFNKLENIFK